MSTVLRAALNERTFWTFLSESISIRDLDIGGIPMRKSLPLLLVIASLLPFSSTRAQEQAKKKPLDIYFLDTEGGQATLFVSPFGESMLVDTGFPGNQGALPSEANTPGVTRDADRIMSVLKLANVTV